MSEMYPEGEASNPEQYTDPETLAAEEIPPVWGDDQHDWTPPEPDDEPAPDPTPPDTNMDDWPAPSNP